ncbi:TetR/AcrR family transcriptional regulator [Stenotrophomonas rhizophila]|uniref:TetR/AcrR family transcriptional regulator n=1 Tax=Stenotrophomonas rhizophila TaxID=216778 RepID=UPI001E3CB7EF|nr:TetR/AcrR family transcriptional regulator [Stenotrophomonas rhizophila]MCC7634612.1 TetR/AcrR family transcriptional regulator [Stenotrophomonas rhizophila]MCC7664119.1 TetR/AcrR family transcriptional regulator [Stenotrophomonas rhizophila]
MARPLSDHKRDAILAAAAKLVAAQGIGASTAQIARAAKVAEGTVFTYFPSKDALLNAVFVQLETRLANALATDFPTGANAHDLLQHAWNALIAWGSSYPVDRMALRQLKVSERISEHTRSECAGLFGSMLHSLETGLADHVDGQRLPFYLGRVLINLLETTLDAMAAEPEHRQRLQQAGFDLFWKGIQR